MSLNNNRSNLQNSFRDILFISSESNENFKISTEIVIDENDEINNIDFGLENDNIREVDLNNSFEIVFESDDENGNEKDNNDGNNNNNNNEEIDKIKINLSYVSEEDLNELRSIFPSLNDYVLKTALAISENSEFPVEGAVNVILGLENEEQDFGDLYEFTDDEEKEEYKKNKKLLNDAWDDNSTKELVDILTNNNYNDFDNKYNFNRFLDQNQNLNNLRLSSNIYDIQKNYIDSFSKTSLFNIDHQDNNNDDFVDNLSNQEKDNYIQKLTPDERELYFQRQLFLQKKAKKLYNKELDKNEKDDGTELYEEGKWYHSLAKAIFNYTTEEPQWLKFYENDVELKYDPLPQRAYLSLSKQNMNLFDKLNMLGSNITIENVVRPSLAKRFEKKMKSFRSKYGKNSDYSKVFLAYHGTSGNATPSITKNGLIIPGLFNGITKKNGSYYGRGIYCSPCVDTAKGYARGNGGGRMFVLAVLPGKPVYNKGGVHRLFHDSRQDGNIWVIFSPAQILPLYVVSGFD
eukprot:TRINITY_DN2178_c1_g1_i1.p1 TRINITY_DN2178_c1_g1~~TRINITY_DN2178_c1_g1_i1.p1  ORF type:complete len:518 (-),score=167.99 TRINITY_DN2178_c1_g1_i1:68-1621(-)